MDQLKTLQKQLDALTSIQLLFSDDRLVLLNAYGQRMLPGLLPGATAQDVFGPASEAFSQYTGTGTLLFSATVCGLALDAKVTAFSEYTAVELTETSHTLSASAIRSISDGIAVPLNTVQTLSQKLLPLLEDSADLTTRERTAQFSQGIYALLRASKHLQLSGPTVDLLLSKKRVDIFSWLREKMEALQNTVSLAQRTLLLDIPTSGKIVEIDPELLERALLNLISNAIKFSDPGSEITVSAQKASGDRVRITVRDQGCGIPAYEMGMIFSRKDHRPQIPDPRTGMGLGLSLARNIISAHGGSLFLESQEGSGTAVHLFLPGVHMAPLALRSNILVPSHSGGFNPILVELADVLPSSAFDSRGIY